MNWLFDILFLVFFLSLVSCCKKEKEIKEQKPNQILYDKYIIVINPNYLIFRITYSDSTNNTNYSTEFNYSDRLVKQITTYSTTSSIDTILYFLNNSGLADSSDYGHHSSSGMTYHPKSFFKYDANNYMISKTDKNLNVSSLNSLYTTVYEYTKGNLTRITRDREPGNFGWTSVTYSYTSFENRIDIDSFKGAFLGKLTANLVQSKKESGSMAEPPPGEKKYQYTLNTGGLVTQMSTLSNGEVIKVTKFEYVFRNK
jgi:hypothetical protein